MGHSPRKASDAWKTAIILPDPQIGFRKFDDGTLDPFHDTKAMSIAIQIIEYEQAINGVEQVVFWAERTVGVACSARSGE